jgi:hypothetical protein
MVMTEREVGKVSKEICHNFINLEEKGEREMNRINGNERERKREREREKERARERESERKREREIFLVELTILLANYILTSPKCRHFPDGSLNTTSEFAPEMSR